MHFSAVKRFALLRSNQFWFRQGTSVISWFYEQMSLISQIKQRNFILDIEGQEVQHRLYPPSIDTPLFTEYEELLQAAQKDPIGVEAPYIPVMLTCNGYEFSHEGAVEELGFNNDCGMDSARVNPPRLG